MFPLSLSLPRMGHRFLKRKKMFTENTKGNDYVVLDRLYRAPVLPRRDTLSVLPKRSLLGWFRK